MSNLELTYNNFITKISAAGRKDVFYNSFKNLLWTFFAFAVLAPLLTSAEAIFEFSSVLRKIFFFGYFSAFGATVILIVLSGLVNLKNLSGTRQVSDYAKRIGGHYPDIKDNLLNALQIYTYTKRTDHIFSDDLISETINQVNTQTSTYDFKRVISTSILNKPAVFFVSAFVIFTALLILLPGTFQTAAGRILNYNYTYIENTLGIAFEVTPGNIEITKGETVDVAARIKFNDPEYKTDEVSLITKTISDEGIELTSNSEQVTALARNEFSARLNSVNSNTTYYFEYKGIRSGEFKITVTAKPVIKSIRLTVYPPAYTKLPTRVVEGTEITAIYGSRIYVEMQCSDNVTRSFVQFTGGSAMPLEISEKNVLGSITASRNGTFRFGIVKEFNGKELANVSPQDYTLNVIPDEYPKISIIDPASDLTLKGEKEIIVRSRVSDDFGFTKMRIGYKIAKTKYGAADKDFRYADIPVQNTDATGLEVPYVWNLSKLNLGTEDEVEYFVEVYDNDGISGPKMTKSETKKLIYPSLDALLNKTEKTKEEIENSLKSAFEDAQELKKQLDELKEKLENNPEELGLNDPKKQQELQNKIENIQNQFSETEKKLDDMMQDLQNNNQVSKETLDKYMELQKMYQKIDSKELREMMKKLQEAMKNMNKDQLKDAMKNFKFDEETFKQSMEKTMELLNKILNEQKLGELTQKLDEITKKQDEVKDQTQKSSEQDKNKMNELSKSQDQLKKEMEEFQKQMKELSEKMKQSKDSKTSEELQKMLNEMKKKQLEQKMQQASDNLQNSKKSDAQDKQEQLSQDLNQMNQQMQDMLQQMMDQENSKTQAKMEEMLKKLQEMSEKQGKLKDKSGELDKNSESKDFQQQQGEQKSLSNDLSKTIDDMMNMSQEMGPNPMLSKNLGDAYNEMNKASEQLGKKEGKGANQSQGNAKDALDKAVEKMQSMCKNGQGKNGKKPGSGLQQLLQALQQMIQKQQQLNQKMGDLSSKGNMGNMSQEQMAEMQKLQGEQQTIQKNLQQLNEEFKKQQELDGKKMLGNLDEVQKEMQEVIKDMQNNNVTPETKKRQDKILSRMLDFQLSQREKDFEQKRESRPGKDFDRSSPSEIVISRPNIINGINQDALDLQNENYSDDYEALIQKYLEKMKAEKK